MEPQLEAPSQGREHRVIKEDGCAVAPPKERASADQRQPTDKEGHCRPCGSGVLLIGIGCGVPCHFGETQHAVLTRI